MNQFPTLVEYLLLHHDYVVIPGLGTFIVQQMDARRNEDEEAFLPPYRSVRFNSDLTQGDNLVLDTIGEIYQTTQSHADQIMATWVNDFKQTLEDSGCVEFGAIGIFTLEENGTIMFSSQMAGVTTPEYYGLDAFHFTEIEPVNKPLKVRAASMEADDKAIIIRINRNIANFVVAACAAVLLFMVFNLPMSEQGALEQRSSALEWFIHQSKESGKPAMPTAIQTETTATTAAPVEKTSESVSPEAETTAATPSVAEQETTGEEYCIVMASAIPQSNAERYVERLKQDGFISARIITTGKMLRVVVGHYPTEQEAADAVRDIHHKSSNYRTAWVHKFGS